MSKVTFDDFPAGICFWSKTVQVVYTGEVKKQYWVGRIDEPGMFETRNAQITNRFGVEAGDWESALQVIWQNRSKLGIQ